MGRKAILILVLFCSALSVSANEILYRIQVGSYERDSVPAEIRKVPKLKKYLLPEAKYTFFSGGYYFFFRGAQIQLDEVKELGFEGACIRVFKDNKLLSRLDGQKYIDKETYNPTPIPFNEEVDKQIFSIDAKNTLENRMILFKEMLNPEPEPTAPNENEGDSLNLDLSLNAPKFNWFNLGFVFGKKEKKEAEVLKIDLDKEVEEIAEEEVATAQDNSESSNEEGSEEAANADTTMSAEDQELLKAIEDAIVEEEAEDIIEESDKIELADNFVVTDIPYFKIYLISNKSDDPTPRILDNLLTPVSPYRKRDMMLYTVGYYETSAEAEADLARYREQGFMNAKIVGYYKGILISRTMGDQILEIAAQQKN